MRRILALIAAAALGVVAFTMVEPAAPVDPSFGTTVPPEPDGATGSPSVWYCSWVDSGALRDSTYDLATIVDVDALISLPSPIPNEEPDTASLSLSAPSAVSFDTATIVRRGEAPGIVEFDDGPATASSVVWGEALVTGDRCVVSVPKVWHLSGGTTADGFFLQLRLFNPFPENAKVTVNGISEFGAEPLPELTGFDVPGRSWVTFDLTRVIPLLDQVSFTVDTDQGLVIPSLVLADESDEASWPGSGLSTTWDFPVTSDAGLASSIVITNTGNRDAVVAVDVFTPDGPIIDASEVVVPAGVPLRMLLSDLAAPPFAVRLRSSAAVSAVVEARTPTPDEETDLDGVPPDEVVPPADDEEEGDHADDDGAVEEPALVDGLAGTVGIVEPASRWLLPGVGLTPGTVSTIWIMNPGPEPATVTLTPLALDGTRSAEKLLVERGSVLGFEVAAGSRFGVDGYLLESTEPVSVAWSVRGERGVAFIAGVAAGG